MTRELFLDERLVWSPDREELDLACKFQKRLREARREAERKGRLR